MIQTYITSKFSFHCVWNWIYGCHTFCPFNPHHITTLSLNKSLPPTLFPFSLSASLHVHQIPQSTTRSADLTLNTASPPFWDDPPFPIPSLIPIIPWLTHKLNHSSLFTLFRKLWTRLRVNNLTLWMRWLPWCYCVWWRCWLASTEGRSCRCSHDYKLCSRIGDRLHQTIYEPRNWDPVQVTIHDAHETIFLHGSSRRGHLALCLSCLRIGFIDHVYCGSILTLRVDQSSSLRCGLWRDGEPIFNGKFFLVHDRYSHASRLWFES